MQVSVFTGNFCEFVIEPAEKFPSFAGLQCARPDECTMQEARRHWLAYSNTVPDFPSICVRVCVCLRSYAYWVTLLCLAVNHQNRVVFYNLILQHLYAYRHAARLNIVMIELAEVLLAMWWNYKFLDIGFCSIRAYWDLVQFKTNRKQSSLFR